MRLVIAMEFQSIFLCALVLSLGSCQYQLDGGQSRAIADYQDDGKHKASEYPQVTVCPEDYSPRDDCVTLDQLLSGNFNKSHTTFKFKPATFEMKPDSVIRFESVSNITLEPAGAYKVDITCVGNNSGFCFNNVSGLTIQDMMFSRCMAHVHGYDYWYGSLTMLLSSDITLRNLTFRHGLGDGISANTVCGSFTIMNSLFTHMQGTGLSYSVPYFDCSSSQRTLRITNSQIDSYDQIAPRGNGYGGAVYAIRIMFELGLAATILLEDITITNNKHRSDTSGVLILFSGNMTVKGINYSNNLVIGDCDPSPNAEFYLSGLFLQLEVLY